VRPRPGARSVTRRCRIRTRRSRRRAAALCLTFVAGLWFAVAGSGDARAQVETATSPDVVAATGATAPGDPATPAGRFTLARCIATAVAQSRLIRDAELTYDVADKQVAEAWSGVLPSIDGTGTYTRNLTANEVFLPAIIFDPTAAPDDFIAVNFSADNDWLLNVHLDQPLFQYEVFLGIGAASRFRALRREELRARQQTVATSVRQLFHEALLRQEQVRLIEESVRRVSATRDEARAMNRVGLISDYDVLRIEVQLANLEPNLLRAQNAVEAARRSLKIAMGIDVDAPVELEGTLRAIDILETGLNDPTHAAILDFVGVAPETALDPDRLWETAEERRTDLRQARLMESLRETQLSAERASLFPRLYGFADYRLTAQENGSPDFFGEGSDDRTTNWSAGIRLEVPIFEGLGRPARIAQRRLAVEQSATMTRESVENARAEIRTALDALDETRERAAAQKRAVAQAQRGFEIASAEYGEGTGSQLQVTDAENALRESEFNYAQAIFDFLNARARLDLAAGIVPGVDTPEQLAAHTE
jgi:outer membrane protein TolC